MLEPKIIPADDTFSSLSVSPTKGGHWVVQDGRGVVISNKQLDALFTMIGQKDQTMKTQEEKDAIVSAMESDLAGLPAEDIDGESTEEQQIELLDMINTIKGNGSNDEALAWIAGKPSDLSLYE